MHMLDPIAEMLARINNAQMAGQKEVAVRASKVKFAIAEILEKEGFVKSVVMEKNEKICLIKIILKYYVISKTKITPAIKGIRRISKEGQRRYLKSREIRQTKNNFGIGIISTSRGVMTNWEAQKKGLGGEYLCEVW
ncbi:MAG: 30S ribosomal protein S8 [Candidatus Moranbacteria bacterium CG_4_9_14_3_um_filter_40_7]|nr:MAG: 30S ribosomal protein S8 [Candidatus Moranbacteria bacterium CG23_combo_of_CG06-09_8_20_14_all_40_16]PIU80698.1 MAG: 30S ribosomal protein S8 [Candidatus Moranbacteria bacterium CG06_land_8_20_14_3_00_40_12]PJA88176.1 MAG: 30S ribosomal protein S8 [Candidatus Moranbacteria bacterium CG_4_9_14_3_um_filter_40_7]